MIAAASPLHMDQADTSIPSTVDTTSAAVPNATNLSTNASTVIAMMNSEYHHLSSRRAKTL